MILGRRISKLSDEELADRYRRNGNKRLVGEVFNRHAHLVYGVCLKYLGDEANAKDATLEIFEKMVQDLKKAEVKKLTGWLHVVSKNHCLMILRKKNHEHRIDPELNGVESSEESELDAVVLAEAKFELLEEAIAQLNEVQRICIELFYLKKHSYKVVSDETGLELKEVKSHIQNGKRNLKNMLLKHDEFRVK